MRPSTLADLAAKYGRPVPEIRGFGSFTVFSSMYEAATDVLRERDDWERLADELCADHLAEGAVYLEPSFSAINFRHRFATDEDCWELVFDVFNAAAERHGIALRWMVAVDRVFDDHDAAVRLASFALANTANGVVSFGLHNDEVGHPPADFVEPFRIAREGGLQITPHAGNSSTAGSWPTRSTSSAPGGSSTGSVRSRSPGWSNGSPRNRSASTSARRRT